MFPSERLQPGVSVTPNSIIFETAGEQVHRGPRCSEYFSTCAAKNHRRSRFYYAFHIARHGRSPRTVGGRRLAGGGGSPFRAKMRDHKSQSLAAPSGLCS